MLIEQTESDAPSEDELRALERLEEARQQRIAALTITLVDRRKKAVEWRAQSGIEQEWSDCEDAYEGIDDANRDTETPVGARMAKPRTHTGGSIGTSRKTGTRSTVVLNITRPYVDAAAARVADMLLPTDDRNFSIQPTPIPELEGMPDVPAEQVDEFRKGLEREAQKRAENAQTRIDDWLTQCLYHAEVRKVIEDCARLGTGILKGPEPVRRKSRKVQRGEDGTLSLAQIDQIDPASRRVDPWDLFPASGVGENINNGACCYERDRLSARQVRDLIGQPGYIESALIECLEEGPGKANQSNDRRTQDDDRYEVWYYTGEITADDFEAVYTSGDYSGSDAIKVVVSLINDRIVKIARSYLDCDDFGYDVMPWQRRSGMPWGIGVAKHINVPQRMLIAATRNMSDNAALSSGPQIVMMRGAVQPADGVFELVPRKQWFADPEQSIDDIRKAFMTIDIPTRQSELMAMIEFALKIAEDVTGLPMLMQGNQGKAPDTVGGMEILNNNGNTVLRRIARTFDDAITEPHIRRYYMWIMEYGEEREKGDFSIDARGSTSLVERDIQRQAILSMGPMVIDPRYELDPALWAEEALRASRINPERLKLSDEKRAQMQAQQEQQMALAQQQERTAIAMKERELQIKETTSARDAEVDLRVARERNETDLAIASMRKAEPEVSVW